MYFVIPVQVHHDLTLVVKTNCNTSVIPVHMLHIPLCHMWYVGDDSLGLLHWITKCELSFPTHDMPHKKKHHHKGCSYNILSMLFTNLANLKFWGSRIISWP